MLLTLKFTFVSHSYVESIYLLIYLFIIIICDTVLVTIYTHKMVSKSNFRYVFFSNVFFFFVQMWHYAYGMLYFVC